MYERLVTEGHDARLLRFSPSADGTIPGSHQDPKNKVYWQVGCLGIGSQACDSACESAFIACVEAGDVSTAEARTKSFAECMKTGTFTGLGCADDCSPTYNMLASSETPTTVEFANFGAGAASNDPRPAESLCSA